MAIFFAFLSIFPTLPAGFFSFDNLMLLTSDHRPRHKPGKPYNQQTIIDNMAKHKIIKLLVLTLDIVQRYCQIL